jgi:hypothetical protein
MRASVLVAAAACAFALAASFAGCGGGEAEQAAGAGGQSASDASFEDGRDAPSVWDHSPPEAAPVTRCKLGTGADPVALCTQKLVLLSLHEAAMLPGVGVASGWNPKTLAPDTIDGGGVAHDLHDDVAYGAAVARYHASAAYYGDTEATAVLDADLKALAGVVSAVLSPLPDEYGGELYFDLRAMAVGLRRLNRDDQAEGIDALAEAYARSIHDVHFRALGGAVDAGADAGAPVEDGVLGRAMGDDVVYEPARVATGALALLDLASRRASAEPASAAAWRRAARASFEHLWARAREPKTGMFFRALVATAGAGADSLVPFPAPGDALLTDVQARAALAFLRAQDLIDTSGPALAELSSLPLLERAGATIAAMNAAPKLWDDARGGYFAGWVPSSSALLDDKPTRANALLFAALHRWHVMGSSPYAEQIKPLRSLLTSRTPPHTGFFSAVTDQTGYFESVPAHFDLDGEDADAGAAGRSYSSAAVAAAAEGFEEQWFGLPK